ncbi:[protein-PII] uridylyltransferase [Methylophilus medardicus]|uniref:Bifunctional uridylyltransferase/uridylyl-removing enzyme n=1 Tax=Methylophilus medardicus TaxID=2588534 RepID=A0A5B8CS10_9PROT|nr:[protein-PII] uridylyltransferase [Methylophilus medardicus]QDC43910.1 [protein-PII] uridylyltransferase [Methylophilus medardicus]QDC48917.1 [protein-PII] uridylyltransferase [Methylophilus medardicus]QDC52622.1 [protein-PII] uridylyltransferase [Methylophilus medardicus]
MTVISKEQLKHWRDALQQARQKIADAYLAKPQAKTLLQQHTRVLDQLLRDLWRSYALPASVSLIAVGGYGRGEMFPHSDIDLLILMPEVSDADLQTEVESLIGTLWDIGLNIGHSVRTLQECLDEAKLDVTIMTNLLEARWLTGHRPTFNALTQSLQAQLDQGRFFAEKLREQQIRHAKFHDTAYNLEPNIKESPGGLRDLHMILWVAQSQGLGKDWSGLVDAGLLSRSQANQLKQHERLLHNLRIRLHLLANRREDRLVFDFQNTLAEQMGYQTTPQKRASEQLMQGFYRSARAIIIENEVLLKRMHARVNPPSEPPTVIDEDFTLSQGLLSVQTPDLFQRKPGALLRCFQLLQQHPAITGFSAPLVRALQDAQPLIDRSFRQNAAHKALFLQILQSREGVHRGMRRMNRYGILGRYIPVFGRVIAQMQHDLFHVYTVDEHTLNVLRNLRRFAKPDLRHEFPLCSQLFNDFSQPHLLYLAAIFHDIAKGRGGDHSQLGTIDARRFCRSLGLAKADIDLVAWLVEAHLKLSSTAQKSDLSDPDVIEAFAQFVGSEYRLTALYLLTVADIRGTSPNVWNAWKAKLLESLFLQTRRVLQQSLNTEAQLRLRKQEVLQKLSSFNLKESSVQPLWEAFGGGYFSRFDSDEIAWQSRLLMPHQQSAKPIVRARLSPKGDGIQVMIYSRDQREIFARICHFFDSMQYNIVQAKIYTTAHGYALDNFIVLEPETRQISYNGLLKHIEQGLNDKLLGHDSMPAPIRGRVSRQVKHMPIATQIHLQPVVSQYNHALTFQQLNVVANDRPGLLASMALIFHQLGIELHNAKINTLGNRVEDSFLISAHNGQMIPEAQIALLKQALYEL